MTYKEDKAIMFKPEDLNAIDNTIYEVKAEELKARQLFNLKTNISPGAETHSYDVITRSGAAKILAPGADDIPLVETDMERHTIDIYSVAVGFRVGIQEMRNAQMTGRSIDTTKAGVARRAIAEKENKIAWLGDPDYNIMGVLNTTGIQTFTLPTNEGGTSTNWADKTGMEILADLRAAKKKVNDLPGHKVDTLVLTNDGYEALQAPVSDYDTRPLLQYINEAGWFNTIEQAPELSGAGDGDTDCFLMYDSSAEVSELLIPMDIMRHDEEYSFPHMKVPLEERTGGVIIRYPQAFVRADGI